MAQLKLRIKKANSKKPITKEPAVPTKLKRGSMLRFNISEK